MNQRIIIVIRQCLVHTLVAEVVFGEFSRSVNKIAKIGEQLRVVFQHEILPFEG